MRSGSRVKFISGGQMHYGIVWGQPEVPEPSLLGELEIVDAIRPRRWILEEQHVYEVSGAGGSDPDEYDAYVARRRKTAIEESDSIKGCKPGKLLRFPMGDHWCFYVIVNTTARLVKLEWRGYDPSRAIDPKFGWEFTMPRKDCLRYIEINDYLSSLLKWEPK